MSARLYLSMLFDIFEYNIPLALGFFTLSFCVLMLLFKKYITSLADPLIYHILWLTSQTTFLVIYAERNSTSVYYFIFLITLVVYIISLVFFFSIYNAKKNNIIKKHKLELQQNNYFSHKKWDLVIFVLFVLYLYSNKARFEYILKCRSLAELALYRFVELQGRNPLERILGNSVPIMFFFLFRYIHKNIRKKLSYAVILFVLLIGIITGGRGMMLSLIFSIGAYVFYYYHEINHEFITKLNKLSVISVILAMIFASIISSMYQTESSVNEGFMIIFNRVFAAPDGIEYYLKYSGDEHIKTGIFPYIFSVFGIYIKNLTGIEYKNIGWQLTELAIGEVSFAQGANYTLLLQAIVFNIYTTPIYAIAIAWIVARFRYLYTRNNLFAPMVFVSSAFSFSIAYDLETFIFFMISSIAIYLVVVYPIIKFKI
jgi:hypothetical protein